jgi:hypothetical protein
MMHSAGNPGAPSTRRLSILAWALPITSACQTSA